MTSRAEITTKYAKAYGKASKKNRGRILDQVVEVLDDPAQVADPVAVGVRDLGVRAQALLGVVAAKHFFVRQFALAG